MPHRFDPTILREYDIRGIVGTTLFPADAHALGRVFAQKITEAGGRRVAVGYDGRLTSPELEAALVDGLAEGGADVVRIGRGPTPMLYFAAATLYRLPGMHILLNADIDGRFPAHHPDPTLPENLRQLQQAVAAESCDLGIAFDGDGDRIGVVDAKGRILWGDQLLVILARDVLRRLPGAPIIADVKASQVLFDEIARAGGRPVMAPTGHSLIK